MARTLRIIPRQGKDIELEGDDVSVNHATGIVIVKTGGLVVGACSLHSVAAVHISGEPPPRKDRKPLSQLANEAKEKGR